MSDIAMQWKYFMIVFYVLLGIPVMFPGAAGSNDIYRITKKYIEPYFWSFSPVALLWYIVYMVSRIS